MMTGCSMLLGDDEEQSSEMYLCCVFNARSHLNESTMELTE